MMARRKIAYAIALLLCLLAAIAAGSVAVAAAAPPTLTIAEPVNGSVTEDSTLTISGSTDEGITPVSVDVYAGGSVSGSPIRELADEPPLFGTWSVTATLPDGEYTAQAAQTSFEGEESNKPTTTFTIDTTPPSVSIKQLAPSDNTTPTLSGGAGTAPGDGEVSVTVYHGSGLGGGEVAHATVPVSDGEWSWVTTPALGEGEYTAHVVQEDAAHNVGSAEMQFTIDTSKPHVELTKIPPYINTATPFITGAGGTAPGDAPDIELTIYEGTTPTGTARVSATVPLSGGGWSYTTAPLEQKTYTAVATQKNEDGEVGESAAWTFTVDTTPPAVSITQLTSPTSSATPTLSGVGGVAPGDLSTLKVTVHHGPNLGGPVAAINEAVSIGGGGAWLYTTPHLEDGEYTAHAVQTDEAGNTGASAEMKFVVDTTKPTVTLEDPKSGSIIETAQPVFDGSASEGGLNVEEVTLTVTPLGSETGVQTLEKIPVSRGKWTTAGKELKLADGDYKAVVEQRDKAGNIGTSAPVTFTIKTIGVTLNALGLVSRGSELVSNATPSFDGTGTAPTGEIGSSVTLNFYLGTSTSGTPVRPALSLPLSGTSWSSGPVAPLPDGTYTVQAEQAGGVVGPGVSKVETFTVDADAPSITLTSPSNDASSASTSETVSGSAGTAPGDLPSVTVELFAGGSIDGQAPAEVATVPAVNGTWSAGFAGLSLGAYTVRAEQSDDVGNTASTAPVTFTVTAPAGPTASFSWLPAAPHTGEAVSLFSTSTDFNSPITGFAWALTPTSAFLPGKSVLSTSFLTPGKHVVRLRITDASGATNTVSETITVTSPALTLMQPFPVVRIAGIEGSFGVEIRLLTVESPIGAKITVICHGPGCPRRSQNLLARRSSKTHAGSVVITFRRFERSLRPGAVLEIRVIRAGEIGKYMSFTIRRGKLPKRSDACVGPTGGKPFTCPAS